MSIVFLLAANAAFAAQPLLPPAPWRPVVQKPVASKAVVVDPLTRADVAAKYRTVFVPQGSVADGWTGNVAACVAGTTHAAFRTAVIERINFYRALSGVPGTVLVSGDANATTNAQAAALMMSAQGDLSHSPHSGWACYNAGGAGSGGGAASANLALGASGPAAIDLYMEDPGAGNEAAGHRRWVLFPPRTAMATGDVTDGVHSNALWVFGPSDPRPATPHGVAWPPRGYVPYQVLPEGSNRWSFSYPGANFSNAVVTMRVAGTPIAVSYDSRTANGYGDNTIVWRPATGANAVRYGAAGVERVYTVEIGNVGGSGVPASFAYTVTVIDGMEAGAAPQPPLFRNGFE